MRYVTVTKLRNFLSALSDSQYEEFMRKMISYDFANIDPKIKAQILTDCGKVDPTGIAAQAAATILNSPELMNAARAMLTDIITGAN